MPADQEISRKFCEGLSLKTPVREGPPSRTTPTTAMQWLIEYAVFSQFTLHSTVKTI